MAWVNITLVDSSLLYYPPMLMFLWGPDRFRLHERLVALRQGFVSKYDASGLSLETLEAADQDAQALPSKLLSTGLFTMKRCVVLHDVFKLSPAAADILVTIIPKIGDDTILIVTAVDLPKTDSKLKTAVLQAQRIEPFPLLDATQLARWVKERVSTLGGSIEPTAVHYLVQASGGDTWRLHGILEQLMHYQPQMTLQAVELFAESPLDDNIFHLTDALSEQQPQMALRVLHDQLESGASPFYILTMLARQLTILLQVKTGGAAAAKLHPYVQKQAGRYAQRFSIVQLTEAYSKVVAVDEQLKTTNLAPAVVLDKLVAELTLPSV